MSPNSGSDAYPIDLTAGTFERLHWPSVRNAEGGTVLSSNHCYLVHGAAPLSPEFALELTVYDPADVGSSIHYQSFIDREMELDRRSLFLNIRTSHPSFMFESGHSVAHVVSYQPLMPPPDPHEVGRRSI